MPNAVGAPQTAAFQAGRLVLPQLHRHFAPQSSFAFETTVARRGCLQLVRQWQSAGLKVKLIFLALPTVDDAIARVAHRVRQGGHDIPEQVIRRRFANGRRNLEALYAPLVDMWALYDNTNRAPMLMEWSENTRTVDPSAKRSTLTCAVRMRRCCALQNARGSSLSIRAYRWSCAGTG